MDNVITWPDTGEDSILIQRWLGDGRCLALIRQIFNYRVTISQPGDEYGYYDAY
jgi:hypothetical protein